MQHNIWSLSLRVLLSPSTRVLKSVFLQADGLQIRPYVHQVLDKKYVRAVMQFRYLYQNCI
jgi:hypothetical protein